MPWNDAGAHGLAIAWREEPSEDAHHGNSDERFAEAGPRVEVFCLRLHFGLVRAQILHDSVVFLVGNDSMYTDSVCWGHAWSAPALM